MKPLNLFKRKRNNDRVLKVEFFDEATACLAKSVQSIIGDPSANRDEMLARSFTQYLQHVGKLTGTRIPLQAVVDLHKIFGIAKNDWDLPGGGVDDPIGDTGGGRRRRRSDDDDAARLDAQMDSDADRDRDEDERRGNGDRAAATDDDEDVEKGMRTMESAHLKALFKRHGFETIAKCNIEKPFLSEFEMTEVGKQEAAERGISFAELYESSITLRKAVEATKYAAFAKAGARLMPIMPTQVGGAAARDVDGNSGGAYEELMRMAQRMKEASPERKLSDAQWFESVYNDAANVELKRREREEAHARLPVSGGRIPI
jgi:hypothetical protein